MQFNNTVINSLSSFFAENSAQFSRTNCVEQYEPSVSTFGAATGRQTKFTISNIDQTPDSFSLDILQFCFDDPAVTVEEALKATKEESIEAAVKSAQLGEQYIKHIKALMTYIVQVNEKDPEIVIFALPEQQAVGLVYKQDGVFTAFNFKE